MSAYRKYYSTETALLKVCNDVLLNMGKRCITPMAAIVLSAAFYTVDHGVLLSVLNANYGISCTALKWVDTYLRPRSFKVCVNNSYSNVKELRYSVLW